MAYQYNIKNAFRPSGLATKPYGWTTAPAYNRADIPTAFMPGTGMTQDQLQQNFAYEWFQSGDIVTGNRSNPPFASGAAGRLHPSLALTDSSVGGVHYPARILRGYIRRAQRETGKPMSEARLYFMYNPEIISRDYVSYLDQGALDPFNTVYQSGNLVAPPSILDFSFELFFDRQEEAADPNHPGVFVDYQFFDMVVRNVFPDPASAPANTIPDNGVMMVNPRDITVVFSPQLTVQGRPLNARVTFEKFTHRMTPVRMRIQLTMRAVYLGPVKDMTEYKAEEFQAEAAIPFSEFKDRESFLTVNELVINAAADPENQDAAYATQAGIANTAGANVRAQALNWAKAHVVEGQTRYSGADTGAARYNLPTSADCSGLVEAAYHAIGISDQIFGSGYPGTHAIISHWESNNYKNVQRINSSDLQYGDIIIKPGHIRFFDSFSGNGIKCFEAASSHPRSGVQVGLRDASMPSSPYFCVRPMPVGGDMNYNAQNNPQSNAARDA